MFNSPTRKNNGKPLSAKTVRNIHSSPHRNAQGRTAWTNEHPYLEIKQTRLSSAGKEIIDTPKSASSRRTVRLSSQAQKEFVAYKVWCRKVLLKKGRSIDDNDFIVMRSDGEYGAPDNFTKRWNNFLKKNNIRHLKLHGLRHTCATMLLQQGVDVKAISQRLGHADAMLVCTTYGHSSDTAGQKAADKLDAVIIAG